MTRVAVAVEGTGITNRFRVKWYDPHNRIGTGEFSLVNDDAQIAVPGLDDLVTFSKDGDEVFYSIIESVKTVDVDSAEAAGQVTTFSGRASSAELERITVYPALGLVASSAGQTAGLNVSRSPWSDDRLFGWPDPVRGGLLNQDPDDADNVILMTGTDRPVGWPDVYCYLVGDSTGADVVYGAALIDDADSTTDRVIVWANFRDEGDLYWNGVHILQVSGSEIDPTKTHRISLEVTPGQPQVLSVKVRKVISANALWAVCVHEVGGADNFLLRTRGPGQAWGLFADPAVQPGISPGEIIMQILDEADDRGLAHGWTCNFDAVNDSNGDPWPLIPIFPTKVGEPLTAVLERLAQGWIDWAVLPDSGGREISAWNAVGVDLPGGGTGAGRGSASGVEIEVGVNALELIHEVTS